MRVLIADDDPTSRLVAQVAVEDLGHDCIVAEDGGRAWELLQETEVDVVVTDWLMPGIDGLDLCRRIREHVGDRYIYIILVTSRAGREHVRTGMSAGADNYLIKPLDPFDLETRLIAAGRVTALHAKLEGYRAELRRLATTDPLTGLRNRLSLNDDLLGLHTRSQRYGRAYGVVMCDVDSFKAYNDAHGHQAGDEVLRTVAAAMAAEMRDGDMVYRFGGEEFLIVLPEQTVGSAGIAAERARAGVEDLGLPHPDSAAGVVTISVGVAAFDPEEEPTIDEIIRRADVALYRAKEAGRNRVVLTRFRGASAPLRMH